MGGRIWVESEPGRGQHVSLQSRGLPSKQSPAVKALRVELEMLRGLAVLVVDDNATNRRIFRTCSSVGT